MTFQYEATRSAAYRFARYVVLPSLRQEAESFGDEPFLLRDKVAAIIDRHLTQVQREAFVPYAKAEGGEPFDKIVRWFVYALVTELREFTNVRRGYFRNKTAQDIEVDAAATVDAATVDPSIDEDDESTGGSGWIYAFSFPAIKKQGVDFPIKIGKTVGDVAARVADQAKGSAMFEQPEIVGSWQVKRIGPTEYAIHFVLKARGKWIDSAPGKEWFKTTVEEIDSILKFINS